MAKAFGIYQHLPPSVKKSIRKINQLIGKGGGNSSGNPQRNHHYSFDVDDNGLDINGFILQTDKHKGKKQKFRVYLDSNENGRFDKSDPLIGKSGLKQKHAAKGVANLLDEGEIGQLEVTFKKPRSNASMRGPDYVIATENWLGEYSLHNALSTQIKSLQRLAFSDSDGNHLGSVMPMPGVIWDQHN